MIAKSKFILEGVYSEDEIDDINSYLLDFRKKHGKELHIRILDKAYHYYTLEDILELVCKITNKKIKVLVGKSRIDSTVQARHLYCYIAKERGFKYTHIGRLINKHHTTAMYAHKVITNLMYINETKTYSKVTRIINEMETVQKIEMINAEHS